LKRTWALKSLQPKGSWSLPLMPVHTRCISRLSMACSRELRKLSKIGSNCLCKPGLLQVQAWSGIRCKIGCIKKLEFKWRGQKNAKTKRSDRRDRKMSFLKGRREITSNACWECAGWTLNLFFKTCPYLHLSQVLWGLFSLAPPVPCQRNILTTSISLSVSSCRSATSTTLETLETPSKTMRSFAQSYALLRRPPV
jgi:hypothetical protein